MGWLWVLSEEGVPYRVPDILKPETPSDIAWCCEPVKVDDEQVSIRQLTSSSLSTYALDSNGAVHVFRHPSVLFVRRSLEIFENQRWYPLLGWQRPLPTDCSRITTADGQRIDFENSLPSIGWKWEESWEVQRESDTDKEGWQYAPLFSKSVSWRKSSGFGSFVRRKRWKRSMRYVSAAKWIPIPDEGRCFSSIAAGCSSSSNGGCILFAVGLDGGLYRRKVSHDLPEGDAWVRMEEILNKGRTAGDGWVQVEHNQENEPEDVVLLACSPTFSTLVAVTWDGKLYLRLGISPEAPSGSSWSLLATPEDRPVTSVSVGSEAMWVTTADGQLWMHQIALSNGKTRQNFSYVSSSSYRNLGKGYYQPVVSLGDQLFVLQGKKPFLREGMSAAETTGKSFVPLIERTGETEMNWMMICASGVSAERIPSHWMTNIAFGDAYDTSFKDAKWRKEILASLINLNERSWDLFQQFSDSTPRPSDSAEDGWNRSIKVRLRIPPGDTYSDGVLMLSDDKFCASSTAARLNLELNVDQLLRVGKSFEMSPFKFCVTMQIGNSEKGTCIRAAFASEKERDTWHEALQMMMRKSYSLSPRNGTVSGCWTIGGFGQPRFHPMNELLLDSRHNPRPRPVTDLRSIDVEGHFHSISAGAERVVWALTETGQSYVLSPHWNPLEERITCNNQEQVDTVTVSVWETQRHQFLRGFQPFTSRVEGLGPLEETRTTGGFQGRNATRLPSQDWSWDEEQWRLEMVGDEDGWTYAADADGSYGDFNNKARFRRRKWMRRARFRAMAPWIEVESPELQSVAVQRENGDRILVWALTTGGEVLVRQGVDQDRPQGYVWKQIICTSPLSAITVTSPTEVWAMSATGRIFVRSCEDQLDMEASNWSEQPVTVPPGKVTSMVVQNGNGVWFIANKTLYMLKGGELHPLCPLAEPSSLCLDPSGNLIVIEGGQVNRHHEWVQTVSKKGRRFVLVYNCKKREPIETGYAKSASFTL